MCLVSVIFGFYLIAVHVIFDIVVGFITLRAQYRKGPGSTFFTNDVNFWTIVAFVLIMLLILVGSFVLSFFSADWYHALFTAAFLSSALGFFFLELPVLYHFCMFASFFLSSYLSFFLSFVRSFIHSFLPSFFLSLLPSFFLPQHFYLLSELNSSPQSTPPPSSPSTSLVAGRSPSPLSPQNSTTHSTSSSSLFSYSLHMEWHIPSSSSPILLA